MERLRVLTLDWGDTLAANTGMPYVAAQRRGLERLARGLAESGCTVPPDWAEHCLHELSLQWTATADEARNPEHRELDFAGMVDRWLKTVDAYSAEARTVRHLVDDFLGRLTEVIEPFADTRPTLALLKARHLRLGILSHVSWPGEACRAWFHRHGLAGYLDFYSLSSDVGWIKPSSRHFQHALTQAQAPPAAVLHVGDHPVRDIEGARAMGMRTCLRVTEGVYPPERLARCAPDATILRIADLPQVVADLDRAAERPSGSAGR